jgi:hypothetical protein
MFIPNKNAVQKQQIINAGIFIFTLFLLVANDKISSESSTAHCNQRK